MNFFRVSQKNLRFFSSIESPISQISLSEPLPHLPTPKYVTVTPNQNLNTTKVTTLENGLKVATEANFGQFITVGVSINSGSRYEVSYPSGISHFLEKLAFGATEKHSSKEKVFLELENYGGICDCQSTRDTFLYAASIDGSGLQTALDIISSATLRPLITEDEIAVTKSLISFELNDIALRPDQETRLLEMIHSAAFSNNTLGLPKYTPESQVQGMSRDSLIKYLNHYHRPERMVLAGVGVDHDTLVSYAQTYFMKSSSSSLSFSEREVDESVSQYTGGIQTMERDLSNVSLGPTPMPELAHLVIALESVSHQHEDFIPFCLLNTLMGGGGSFSAGGPGKGMYTRLYTRVLNRYHWIYHCQAANHSYSDGGIFCISSSAHPSYLGDLAQVIVQELSLLMTESVSESELKRAKKQLTSMLLMNIESRPVIFEDIARQVLASGIRRQPQEFIESIEKINVETLRALGNKMLASKPSIASIGNLQFLPSYKDIESGLLHKKGLIPKKQKFSLFQN